MTISAQKKTPAFCFGSSVRKCSYLTVVIITHYLCKAYETGTCNCFCCLRKPPKTGLQMRVAFVFLHVSVTQHMSCDGCATRTPVRDGYQFLTGC